MVNSQNQQHMLMKDGRENILQRHGGVQAVPKDNGQAGQELVLVDGRIR